MREENIKLDLAKYQILHNVALMVTVWLGLGRTTNPSLRISQNHDNCSTHSVSAPSSTPNSTMKEGIVYRKQPPSVLLYNLKKK